MVWMLIRRWKRTARAVTVLFVMMIFVLQFMQWGDSPSGDDRDAEELPQDLPHPGRREGFFASLIWSKSDMPVDIPIGKSTVLFGHESYCHLPIPAGFNEAQTYDLQRKRPRTHDLPFTLGTTSFAAALSHVADTNKIVLLSSFDFAYLDVAWNLYLSSIRPLKLTNHLFVCTDREAQNEFHRRGVPCFLFANGTAGTKSKKQSVYYSPEFIKKTHIKTRIILDALLLGYTVLIMDIDIVLFKNPLPYLDSACSDCDILIQDDMVEFNSGFYLTRPTKAGISLHTNMLKHTKHSSQKTIRVVLGTMTKRKQIRHKKLSRNDVPCGRHYFENGHRMWPQQQPCAGCVMMHNNWINTGHAKIYRFKEHLLWFIDRNRYYSDPGRRYLSYENPVDFGSHTVRMERHALKSALALGHLLNRTVILPSFSCAGCEYLVCTETAKTRCALNTQFRIDKLDESFADQYREHTFLCNPLVPVQVKSSASDLIYFKTPFTAKSGIPSDSLSKVLVPKSQDGVITLNELQQWIHKSQLDRVSILRFHSLYGVDLTQHGGLLSDTFMDILQKSLIKSEYRQY